MLLLAMAAGEAASQSVPNADFDKADSAKTDAPADWNLTGGEGRWLDREVLEVTGHGDDSNYWRSSEHKLTSGKLYHFQMLARRMGHGGSAIAGPTFANRDYGQIGPDWEWVGHVFRVPENGAGGFLRLGHWKATGKLQFDAVKVTPTLPVHRSVGNLTLGDGESIRDGRYTFHGTFAHKGSNYHRVLESSTAGFNSNRWNFGDGSRITYRFAVPECNFTSGGISFNVNYHTRGGCTAEASRDGAKWYALATQEGLGSAEAKLPTELFPAPTILFRLGPAQGSGSFQVDRIEFQADLDGAAPDATGETGFADVEHTAPGLAIEQMALQEGGMAGETELSIEVANTGILPVEASLTASISQAEGSQAKLPADNRHITVGESATFRVSIPATEPGDHQLVIDIAGTKPGDGAIQTRLGFTVPDFYRTDYGELLAGANGQTAVWWCAADHKIPRRRAVPKKLGKSARLSAAKNDFEAVQIVVRPGQTLKGLTARVSGVKGPHEKSIRPQDIQILRVYYHFVDHPTDRTGVRDWWPDALPPLDEPIDVEAGQNQPLWVLVHVPDDAVAGDYDIDIELSAEGWASNVPVGLHVWDFTLPKTNHLETAFGFSPSNVFRYHGLKTDEDKRRVLDMYFELFSDHRISPYDPTPMDQIRVKFVPDADPPRADLDFSVFDRAMTRAIEKFHFTGFRLGVQGMGGGTFHARFPPKIADYPENTPQYQAMFSSYMGQLDAHFRERGWLHMPYIYWFDEPAPKDYQFVADGMQRLKKYAPGLQRMLTEEPGDAFNGPVDIWCPLSPNYDHQAAQKCRARGERFWWYVCTGPKAPYCTLFIDHPATELRVWHWQTWQRDIVGTLVWQSSYWTSSAAYPEKPQDPYQDPMGYRSGYSTPKGVKAFWGNGDGRFIYPPLAAATPGVSGAQPVIEPPVSSIRWEMIREGVEDYETLYMLRELTESRADKLTPQRLAAYRSLLDVPQSITKDMTHFTTDPAPILARRAEVARAIEELSQ